jgi:hypothetical protein
MDIKDLSPKMQNFILQHNPSDIMYAIKNPAWGWYYSLTESDIVELHTYLFAIIRESQDNHWGR